MSEVKQGISEAKCDLPESLPVSWHAGGSLPPELQTGHKSIDLEHAQLLGCIQTLRGLCREYTHRPDCSECAADKREACEDKLVAILGDLLAFILEHFKNEEVVMRDSMLLMVDREVCEAHMEDHANIAAKVQEIILALQPLKTVVLLRDLDVLLQRWISNHIMLHDLMLGRWLESRGEQLNFS